MHKIILASNNSGKIREIQALLHDLDIEVIPQSELGVSDIEETGLTFVENAILKARNAAGATGMPALADDSGLEVDALKGKPGIHSKRFSGPQGNDKTNITKLLAALQDVPEKDRTARFQCILVYLRHAEDPTPIICQGTWEGRILFEPHGQNGFGYDPVFYVPTHKCSAAELPSGIKNQLSHRGQALQMLLKALSVDDSPPDA